MSTNDENGQRLITGYVPKLGLTAVGLAVFVVLSTAYWIHFFRQGRRYMLVLCLSSTLMALGFGIRIPMTNDPGSLGIYIGQYMFILLSPCGFLANSYVILPRLATWLDAEDCLFLKSRIIVRLFVWSDVTTFLLQASGGGLTAMQDAKMSDIGHWIALVGLIIAAISFGTFSILTIVFGFRVAKRHPEKWSSVVSSRRGSGTYVDVKLGWTEDWRTVYWALLWSGAGIIIRCIFRVAEFAQGYDGELRTVEVWFYVLDTLPLVIGIAVWAVVWPPKYLNEPRSFEPGQQTNVGGYEMGRVEAYSPDSSKNRLVNHTSPRY